MLSPTGPTDGLVVSPLNGEIPGRMAILQGHPEDDESHLLSSMILGVNESILALAKTGNLDVTLVSPVCQAFKDRFLAEAGKIRGLSIVEAASLSVERKKEVGPLSLTFSENGKSKKENFDLIVVLTKPKVPPEIVTLSKKLDQEIL